MISAPNCDAVADRLADLVAGLGRDDDPDLGDPGLDQRLDPVEEHGLVRHRHELLRRGVRDRAQAGAGAAGEDQALERLHGGARVAPGGLATRNPATAVVVLVGPAELAVVPGGGSPRLERIATRFGAWASSASAPASLDRLDLGVAEVEILAELEHGLEVAMDDRLGLDLDAAQLLVLVTGLDQKGARGSRSRFFTFCDFA